jgi:hypothetical protein
MTDYDVRKTHRENLQVDRLKALMQESFGEVQTKDGKLVSSYGALKELVAWPAGKDVLGIETKTDPNVDNEVAQSTIKAYNTFLERATGYTSKERGKRLQKKAKQGKL